MGGWRTGIVAALVGIVALIGGFLWSASQVRAGNPSSSTPTTVPAAAAPPTTTPGAAPRVAVVERRAPARAKPLPAPTTTAAPTTTTTAPKATTTTSAPKATTTEAPKDDNAKVDAPATP